jgi:hypothetical protein
VQIYEERLFNINFIGILSCKKSNSNYELEEKAHMELHKEMDKVDKEYYKFEEQLTKLYAESENEPEKVMKKSTVYYLRTRTKKININHKSNLILTEVYIVLKQNCFIILANIKNQLENLVLKKAKLEMPLLPMQQTMLN